ncbi:MAG: hypothetical protein NDI73_07565 [Desulfuromonadales bacterium]|nr:hypothetical protein [Desulfuromonadales bacterium]
MLRIFHSIFGASTENERYPEAVVREAIERAVDGTNPWLRGLSGYRRKLRPAVLHAIDHIVALANSMQTPLELSRESYGRDPQLQLYFISSEQMEQILRADPELTTFRAGAGNANRPAWAQLVMKCEQHRAFGVDLLGETIVRDVPQVTVSMSGHRLLDPTADLAETRRHLMRRAFNHLLELALARIAAVEDVREELLQQRTLLQAKHDALERTGWGFSDPGESSPQDDELHRELAAIEKHLLEVGGDDAYIEKDLEILIDVLANAEHQLWVDSLTLIVDRMGIRRNKASADAPELVLRELHNAAGLQLVARMVVVPPAVAGDSSQ